MPRTTRVLAQNMPYHVTDRGNGGQRIFLDQQDFQRFLQILVATRKELPFSLWAYCLMTNHFHLLIKTSQHTLDTIMHRVLIKYARYFNKRWDREGGVFYERYWDKPCTNGSYLMTAVRYIHMNPVEAGLVRRPEDWAWSSHREYLSVPVIVETGAVLEEFGGLARYKEFMAMTERPSFDDLLRTTTSRRDFILAADRAGHSGQSIATFLGYTRQAIYNTLRRHGNS